MAVSPDDRFAGLITSSAERGGWVPGDVIAADAEGEEEPVAPRRVRLPVLIALVIATTAVLAFAFYVFRPAESEQAPVRSDAAARSAQADPRSSGQTDPGSDVGAASAEGTGGAAGAEVVVHVTGEVEHPSVVTLAGGSRVRDAVEAAGGLTSEADPEAVNLARVIADGEQIRIPAVGEELPETVGGPPPPGPAPPGANPSGSAAAGSDASGAASSGSNASGDATGAAGKIDLNTADATQLETLPGVGPVTAEAIIAHRQETPFTSIDDLLLVKGIGPKTFESLKDLVTVG